MSATVRPGGLLLIGVAYDFWTLNDQISEANAERG